MVTNGNINRLFVPYELALKLKEKGFDEPCFGSYIQQVLHYKLPEKHTVLLQAPLYQQVIDWLFNKNIFIDLGLDETNGVITFYIMLIKIELFKPFKKQPAKLGTGVKYEQFDIPTKEEALNKAIEEALKLI